MEASSGVVIAGKLLAVLILVLANGFFVAAEFALVAVRRSRVDQLVEEERPRAKSLQRAVGSLDSYLAATQLGVTMSSLGLGWVGEPAIADLVFPLFEWALPTALATVGAHTLSVIMAFTIMTALHIVLGELAPKSLALQRPEDTALSVIQPLEFYLTLFRPAVHVLNELGNWVLSLVGLRSNGGEELVHSPDEIRLLVAASRQAGLLGEAEEDVVERVFRMGTQRVSAIMTPRLDIIWLDIDDPIAHIQNTIVNNVYSHFPVSRERIDDLLGFVRAKDFLAAAAAEPLTITTLAKLLTPSVYIPESMRALNALNFFKQSGSHIALVVDEYGAVQGLVTLNDILEAIVGDIRTGNEPFDPEPIHNEDGSWLIDGLMSIDEFKDLLAIREFPDEEEFRFQTVGGLVLTHLGRVPDVSDSLEWEDLQFKVVAMDGNRIDKVLVTPIAQPLHDHS